MDRIFLTGAETVVKAALDIGADYFFGYPITPGTEVLSIWAHRAAENKSLGFLQTEDEIAAGFALAGAVMAGRVAFTATAGPGTILMQDPLVMAEAMRLPVVLVVAQRGGPSTGTVIYSQQEVNLAIYGGNNEGMRLVYSPSNLSELYSFTQAAFVNAWKYRFPAVVLTDGYLLKTRAVFEPAPLEEKVKNVPIAPLGANLHLPNIYTLEEELNEKVLADAKDFSQMAEHLAQAEEYETREAKVAIIAHGTVGAAAKQAVNDLRAQGKKVGLFRPITLSPFPQEQLNRLVKGMERVVVVESSLGQLERLVKSNLDAPVKIEHYLRPALGIEAEEIIELIK